MQNTKHLASKGLGSKSSGSFYLLVLASALLIGSVIINVVLAEKLRAINGKLSKVESEAILSIGDVVPDLEAENFDGTPFNSLYSDDKRSTVLYVFSTTCVWCTKNLKNMQALYEGKGTDYRFIGISMSSKGLGEYVAQHKWNFPVVTDPSPGTMLAYKLGGTPQTIIISNNGKVLKNWSGAYMNSIEREVEGYFQIKLPGFLE